MAQEKKKKSIDWFKECFKLVGTSTRLKVPKAVCFPAHRAGDKESRLVFSVAFADLLFGRAISFHTAANKLGDDLKLISDRSSSVI